MPEPGTASPALCAKGRAFERAFHRELADLAAEAPALIRIAPAPRLPTGIPDYLITIHRASNATDSTPTQSQAQPQARPLLWVVECKRTYWGPVAEAQLRRYLAALPEAAGLLVFRFTVPRHLERVPEDRYLPSLRLRDLLSLHAPGRILLYCTIP